MNDVELCWSILPQVSRNFSLCIKLLPQPIDERMMLAYLLFRFIDTIEDSTIPLPLKKDFFEQFIDLIESSTYSSQKVDLFQEQVKKKLTYTYEAVLIDELAAVLRLYFQTPLPDRGSLQKYATLMAHGMYRFQTIPIRTFQDQDEYCFYVAGVVAQLFNEYFFNNGRMTKEDSIALMPLAKDYGLALQKVNILRDIADDIPKKRHYWPEEILHAYGINRYEHICSSANVGSSMKVLSEMTNDAWRYLRRGLTYVKNLEKRQLKIRAFCLLPLFMAVEHLKKCVNNKDVFIKGRKAKLHKLSLAKILFRSFLFGSLNQYLEYWFSAYHSGK